MFRSVAENSAKTITIRVNDRIVACAPGENLAAVLLREGFAPFRSTVVSGAPRMPYCMMGVCFDCLAVVDGSPNRQTCLTETVDNMTVVHQAGGPDALELAGLRADHG